MYALVTLYQHNMATVDLFEYATTANARTAYPSDDTTEASDTSFTSGYGGHSLRADAAVNLKLGMGFTPANTGYISSVSCKLQEIGNIGSGDVWAYIYDNSSGYPGSAISVQSSKITATNIGSGYTWQNFTFTTPVSVAASTLYHIVLEGDYTINSSNCLQWYLHTSDQYAGGSGSAYKTDTWSWVNDTDSRDFNFNVYYTPLQNFSESTIKNEGTYSMRCIAQKTSSLNNKFTRTVDPVIDLTGVNTLKFDLYASRTGSNIKVAIHDSGGTTTDTTPSISSANTWETTTWDISAVSDANKNAIDSIVITVVNADAVNNFYIDNFITYAGGAAAVIPNYKTLLGVGS